jgi:glycine/D-amino acid oxidase-like deaminating enzyme
MSVSPRVVVVGAGIVGASVAFHLARRGAAVTVLDAAEPGGGVSATSMCWLNACDKKPRHYGDLNRLSLEMWDRFARRLDADVGLSWGGELRWTMTPAGADAMVDRVERHQSLGYPIRLIDPSEIERIEPAVAPGPAVSASYSEIEGHVDAAAVIRACLDRASGHGAEVHAHTAVTGLGQANGTGETTVSVDGDEIGCDVVVLAAGADTPELAAHVGLNVPMTSPFGAVILTEPCSPVLESGALVQTPHDLPWRASIRQLPDGTVMMHGLSPAVKGSMGRTEAEVEQVREVAGRFVPALDGVGVAEVRTSGRPTPEDGLPVMGFAAAAPSVYLAAMHNAVTLAPLAGELAAVEILDRTRVDLLEPCRIERFG